MVRSTNRSTPRSVDRSVDRSVTGAAPRLNAPGAAATISRMAKTCIAGRMRLVNRVITNIYDDALRPLGLKISQGNILIVAGSMGVASPGRVCRLLRLDVSTLSRNVELMRRNGWLEDVPGDDARSRPFRLTPAGKRLVEKALPAWERAQAEARKLLGEELVAGLDQAARRASRGGWA